MFGLVRQRGGDGTVIVAGQRQHAAEARCAGSIGMFQDVD